MTDKKIPRIYFFAALVFALVAAAAQTVVFITNYDESTMLYNLDAAAPTVLYTAVIVILIAMTTLIFAVKKGELSTRLQPSDRITAFTALLAGFQLIAAALLHGVYYFSDTYELNPSYRGYLTIVMLITAAIAGCYFISTAIASDKSRKSVQFFGIFVILWAALYLMDIYFEMNAPLNSPIRILSQISLIAIMLVFLCEVRLLIGIPKPRLYLISALAAIIIIALSSVSDIVLTVMGIRANGKDTIFRIAEIAIMLYLIARVRQYLWEKPCRMAEETEDEVLLADTSYEAEESEEQINEENQ